MVEIHKRMTPCEYKRTEAMITLTRTIAPANRTEESAKFVILGLWNEIQALRSEIDTVTATIDDMYTSIKDQHE